MRKLREKTKSRILTWLLSAVFVLQLFPCGLPASAAGGSAWDGSLDFSWYDENDRQTEYHISTPAQWAAIAWICSEDLAYLEGDYAETTGYNVTSITGEIPTEQYTFPGVQFYLDNDLDMGGAYHGDTDTWTGPNYYPIGGEYRNDGYTHAENRDIFFALFSGSFDGQGHTISNIYCSRGWGAASNPGAGWYQAAGLFGRIGGSGTEDDRDIIIENVAVSGFVESSRSVGGIVGKTLSASGGYSVIIRNCLNYATVMDSDAKGVGGIVGAAWNGCYIINCANFGLVLCGRSNGGGIAGSSEATCISCYNVGDVTESVYNHGQAYGTDNGGTELINFYYAVDSVIDAGYPAIYGSNQSKYEFTALAAEDMQSPAFLAMLNRHAGEYGWWVMGGEEFGGYPVPEIFGDGSGSGTPPPVEGTYLITLSGDDRYTVNLENSGIAYRTRSMFSMDANEKKTLFITMDEDYVITDVMRDGGAGAALLMKREPGVYELSNVRTDLTITVISAYGCTHQYQETDRKDATCDEGGYVSYRCSKCGETYTEILEAGAHDYLIHVVEPDGTNGGYTEYTCSLCGDSYIGDYTWQVRFDSAGGSEVEDQIVADGACAVRPEDPFDEVGSMFAGWYTDEARQVLYDFSRPVTENLVLYADWSQTAYHVGFSGEHASALINGVRIAEAVIREEGGSVTFSVEEDEGYQLVSVRAEEISLDSIWDGSVASGFAGGKGTAGDPYRISNAAQLAYLAQQVNSGQKTAQVYYSLTRGVDLNGLEWTPIGTESNPFRGFFYGNGNTVANLYINAPNASEQGLFGCVAYAPYIQLGGCVYDLTVTGSVTGSTNVGGIAGLVTAGQLYNCTSCAAVTATGNTGYAGGVAGMLENASYTSTAMAAAAEGCVNYGTVESGFQAGGITGRISGGLIYDSINYGDVSAANTAGGIAGGASTSSTSNGDLEIARCGNHGTIRGGEESSSAGIGGIVGQLKSASGVSSSNQHTAKIQSCYHVGAIISKSPYTGGIAGDVEGTDTSITDCYNAGAMTSEYAGNSVYYIGGIAGYVGSTKAVLQNCYSTMVPTGSGKGTVNRGGIAGEILYTAQVSNNYWIGTWPKGWNSYSSATMSGCAQKVSSADALKGMADTLGTAYRQDLENLNDGYPVLVWQKPEKGPEGGAQLTSHGDGSYTLSDVTGNVMVYFETQKREYPVSFVSEEHGTAPAVQMVPFGNPAAIPAEPTEANYRFEGWFLDEACTEPYDFSTPVTKAITLYAKWDFLYYIVEFHFTYDTEIPSQKVDGEPWLAVQPEDPVREGYGFTGWYTDRSLTKPYDFDTKLTGDLQLFAGWKAGEFTVTIDPDNGGEPEKQTVRYENYAVKPGTDPVRDGYLFAGWYLEEENALTAPFYFSTTAIRGDTHVKARWMRAVPVLFETDPENAAVKVSLRGQSVSPQEDGSWILGEGAEYLYQVSAAGYQTASEFFTVQMPDPDPEPPEPEESDELDEPDAQALDDEAEEEQEPEEEEPKPAAAVITVELEPVQDLTVSFDSPIPVKVSGGKVTSVQVKPGRNLSFSLAPEPGRQVARISLETGEMPASIAYVDHWDGFSMDADWKGTGSRANPYQISSAAQLAGLAWKVNEQSETMKGKYFILTADLDLEGFLWTPIGGNGGAYRSFQGSFDGSGHTISNLYIDSGSTSYVGLFGYLSGAAVSNLTLDGVNITGYSYVGGLAGAALSDSAISSCTVSGTVRGTHTYSTSTQANYSRIGGVAGSLEGSITNCENSAAVSGGCGVGGVIGSAEGDSVTLSGCRNTGDIAGERYTGGVIGLAYTRQTGTLSQLENTGTVTGGSETGGVAGDAYRAALDACANRGAVLGTQNVGGLTGLLEESSSLNNSYQTGAVTLLESAGKNAAAGGLAGSVTTSSTMKNCYSTGVVTGGDTALTGGLTGQQLRGTLLTNCFWLDTAAAQEGGQVTGRSDKQTTESLQDYQMRYDSFVDTLGSAFVRDYTGQNDGYPIAGWQSELGVRVSGDGTWTATLTNIQNDTDVLVVVEDILYDVTWAEDSAYTIVPAQGCEIPLAYGEDFRFAVEFTHGYEPIQGEFKVAANGTELLPEDGVYVIQGISEHQRLTISGYEMGTYTVTLDANGGVLSGSSQFRVTYPRTFSKPATPKREGAYVFLGWFLDPDMNQEYDFSAPVTHDFTLYAGWFFNTGMYMIYDLNLPQGASATGEYAGQTEIQRVEEQGQPLTRLPANPTCAYRSQTLTAEFLYWSDTRDGSNGAVDLESYLVPQLSAEEMGRYQAMRVLPKTTLYAQWKVESKPAVSGEGTYSVQSVEDLMDLADAVTSGQVDSQGMVWSIESDLLLNDFVSVGTADCPFQGIVEGNGHTITLKEGQTGGLFGFLGENAEVRNLTVTGMVTKSGTDPLGLLADVSYGVIEDCTVTGSVTGREQVGGAVGVNYGNLFGLTAQNVTVTGSKNIGGIVGQSGTVSSGDSPVIYTEISDCTVEPDCIILVQTDKATGLSVNDWGMNVGGIAGMSAGSITNCTNDSQFVIQSTTNTAPWYIGGITGVHYGDVVENCVNHSDVWGTTAVGGIAGALYPMAGGADVSGCFNTGGITADGYSCGGIVGWGTDTGKITLEYCRNTGDLSSIGEHQNNFTSFPAAFVGGIIGNADAGADLSYCANVGAISARAGAVGGLAGFLASCDTIMYSYSAGGINDVNAREYVGGLAGYIKSGSTVISNGYWYGKEFKVGASNQTAGYAVGKSGAAPILVNFYYCSDTDCGMGSVSAQGNGRSASAFQSGEVSYLLDLGDPAGGTSGRDQKWSLLDETKNQKEDRYPTLMAESQYDADCPGADHEYYMVTLKGEVEYQETESVSADRSHNEGGSAVLTEAGGESIAIADASETAIAHAGRSLTLTVDALPSSETWQDAPEDVLDEEGAVKAQIIRTWHWEVSRVTAEYTLNAGGSGSGTFTDEGNGRYTLVLDQEGNYVVTVTFIAVFEEEMVPVEPEKKPEEPEQPEGPKVQEPEEDPLPPPTGQGDGAGTGNGDGNGDGRGDGEGSGNGRGDGDNGRGDTPGGGDGGQGSETTITDSNVPMSEAPDSDSDIEDAATPLDGEPSSEAEIVQAAPVAPEASIQQGDRSEAPENNDGAQGGSLEGGEGEEPAETADVRPRLFEILQDPAVTTTGWILFLLALLALAAAGAIRRYRRYRKEERGDETK